ncbi:MAG: hypothetical protein HY646_07195 [Acidobacteria bacterium]|nr:hypothetical protein [Acidobacteriota bacterium]
MLKTLLVLLILARPQADAAFKKEAPALQASVDDTVNNSIPGLALLQKAKATYLEGFGVLVSFEVALEPPPNPFSSNPKRPEEIRKLVADRRAMLQPKLEALIKQRVTALQSVGATESLALVVHLFNPNPTALPNLPGQIVLTVKKQDPSRVKVSEY